MNTAIYLAAYYSLREDYSLSELLSDFRGQLGTDWDVESFFRWCYEVAASMGIYQPSCYSGTSFAYMGAF